MLSTANSDTINYISSSSDSISTFWVVAGLVTFIYKPGWRKYLLYLIPVSIGALFKPTAIVFPALLAVYVFLFEKNDKWPGFVKRIIHTILVIIPAMFVCFALYELQAKLTPPTYVSGGNPYTYIITQPFVILHYFIMYYFPLGLSADSDWLPITSMASCQFIMGTAFIVILLAIAIVLIRKPKYAPVTFGIAWFLIALIPTTVVPLAEVMNDHRAFFPYVGVAIASGWIMFIIWDKLQSRYSRLLKGTMIVILVLNAAGTFARNFVWRNEESLWHDVSVKSPRNGRGLMNYGLSLMARGDYKDAEIYYRRAIQLLPYYSYAYENMAILKAAQKQYDTAEIYYRQALGLDSGVPILHYYYGKYLHSRGKDSDAIRQLQQAISLSPADMYSRYLLLEIYRKEQNWLALSALANQTLAILPGDSTAKACLTLSATGNGK
jgi:tetratricopeptide (TPR) repeat protein